MYELLIPSMTCQHCVRTVTETVQRVDPQATLDIDLATHRVSIESDMPQPAFAAALAEDGYAPA